VKASAIAACAALVVAPVSAAAKDARVAPAADGSIGAWLVVGPYRTKTIDAVPPGIDERALRPANGATIGEREPGKPARVRLATPSGDDRRIDLKTALEEPSVSDAVAYASVRVHVDAAGRYLWLLGVDDGVRMFVDGAPVFTRDVARVLREDDDVVPIDLTAGDHDIVLKLRQRSGAWIFRAKLVEPRSLGAAPGTWFSLANVDDHALASRLASVRVRRGFEPLRGRYEPLLTVTYPDGRPLDAPLDVAARFEGDPPFSFRVGEGELEAALPPIGKGTVETRIGGEVASRVTFVPHPNLEHAAARARVALERAPKDGLLAGSLSSMKHLVDRAKRALDRADADLEAQADEARELEALAEKLEQGRDPYEGRTGMMRRAIVSPFDDALSEVALYVPPGLDRAKDKKYPLVVLLHGLNSYPISIMRALFGLDDEKREPAWKDRHFPSLPPVDAFVIAPYARGNTMYREIGEDDVLEAIAWARSAFPIDETRITVTGPSMGGIGAASLPFHFPHVFAAAAPLCGYHSYVIRADIASRPQRPWEKRLLEERSNVYWAENGEHLPLWIVHGRRDQPEANSGVLIDRYEALRYSVKHEHPDLGHNVWGTTYADLKGFAWLLPQKLDPRPKHVRFRTLRTRYGTSAWVHVDEIASPAGWADVDARWDVSNIVATTSGVAAIHFDAPGVRSVKIDGTSLTFDDEPVALHKESGAWAKGASPSDAPRKGGRVTGPIRDVFHEPIVFVWADDPVEGRVNERVARSFAERPGIVTAYPIVRDIDFLARGEALANDRALFLVGRTNRVLAQLGSFPIRVTDGAVTIGTSVITGPSVGAAFIHPNPLRPDRYVVVIAGADALGTFRAMSLPELLPDFVVWDEAVARARGDLLLGGASVRAGGFFETDWSLPKTIADPLRR
jgi:predicted esterase